MLSSSEWFCGFPAVRGDLWNWLLVVLERSECDWYIGSTPSVLGVSLVLSAEDFHHFVAEVVDYFSGDATGGVAVEGAGGVAVQGFPSFAEDFGLEGGL